jgi:oligopeptide/dipeptide ABC transporter ATP-binding protein
MEPLLEVANLNVDFATPRGLVHALRHISLTARRGRVLGIVGESGSGKSTVLWSILRLLSANAIVRSGSIRLEGRDLLALREPELRALRGERVSAVFQDPMTSQIPVLTYGQQMLDVLERRKASRADKRRLAVAMMRRVGISDPELRVDQYPHQFSGGMRQRAGIAMAMMTDPALLLADEPTTALDVTTEAQIVGLIRGLQQELEATVIVVSHNLGLIAALCDDVVVMYAGEVVERGDLRTLFPGASHPYTRALLECDPARVTEATRRLPVIPGEVPDLAVPPRACVFAGRCSRTMPVCREVKPPDHPSRTGTVARCHLVAGPFADPGWPAPSHVPTVTRSGPRFAPPAPDAGDALLDVRDLHVRFSTTRLLGLGSVRAVEAVAGVSLRIESGRTLGLVGESGSGKTTLGRAVLNLVPAQAGSVRFAGHEILGMSERAFAPFRRDMAMMFQDPVGSLSPRRTVRSLMTEPLAIHAAPARDIDAEAERLCDMVRVPRTLLSRYPHELSGGQARRVGVARALALEPKLVVADEPTAGLDVSVQGEILNLMSELQAAKGLSYLLVTHNLAVVRHVSDRLAIMYLGRIVEEGPTDVVFTAPAHPYTHALVNAPRPAPGHAASLRITGEVPSPSRRPSGCEFHPRCPVARDRCRIEPPTPRFDASGRSFVCHFPLTGAP